MLFFGVRYHHRIFKLNDGRCRLLRGQYWDILGCSGVSFLTSNIIYCMLTIVQCELFPIPLAFCFVSEKARRRVKQPRNSLNTVCVCVCVCGGGGGGGVGVWRESYFVEYTFNGHGHFW